MGFFLLSTLILLCSASLCQSPGSNVSQMFVPRDTRPNKAVLRVGTYNAEWLFLRQWNKRWVSYAEAVEHLHLIAGVLRLLDYDVLNLVEVESCEVLLQLINVMGDSSYRAYLVPGTDTATGQNVALLTRVDPTSDLWRTEDRVSYPVEGNNCGSSGSGTYGVSKHYFGTIKPVGFPSILLASVHFLAFPDQAARCAQREAQAKVIQNTVARLAQGNEVIIFGDLNDWDGATLDAKSSRPISRVLAFLRASVPGSGALLNVGARTAQPNRYTAYYSPGSCAPKQTGSSSIDHVLVSPGLYGLIQAVNPFRTDVYDAPCAVDSPYSDHWPILVSMNQPFNSSIVN